MNNLPVPFEIFLPWFRIEDYTQYKTLTELTNAYLKGEIKGGEENGLYRTD